MSLLIEVDPSDVCRRYGSSILRRARALLHNLAEAEDASQEVMMMLMSKREQFRGDSDLGAWVYRMTTNVCLNRLREQRRRGVREQRDEVFEWQSLAPKNPYEGLEARQQLQRILEEHDALSQQVFVYKYLDGLTQEEIASVTGISRRTIGKRLQQWEVSFRQLGEATS